LLLWWRGPLPGAAANESSGRTVQELLKPENKQKLISILTYHVVPGDLMAAQGVKDKELKAVGGQPIMVHVSGGKVKSIAPTW
jgi:uncharacterized surface protein with fasciclin (FAS1) repeats